MEIRMEYPEFPYTYYHLGFYYLEEREYDLALNEWNEYLRLAVDCESKYEVSRLIEGVQDHRQFERGRDLIMDGSSSEGLRIIVPLVNKYEAWSEAKYFAALGYRKIGSIKRALELLNELLESGEDFPEIYNELGLCSLNNGEIEKAVENLKKAVDLKPYDTGFLCNLALAVYQWGDIVKAKEYIYKAYSINPEDQITLKCREWLEK
jgi:tetratricopeptide (TPR) repeat protein